MKNAEIVIAHPSNENEVNALYAFLKALKIKFETTEQSTYDSEFISKILQGDKDLKAGKGRKVTIDELDKQWK